MSSNVDHPRHYNTNNPIMYITCPHCQKQLIAQVECIDVIRDLPTWKGNAIKYLWREGLKSDGTMTKDEKVIEDLQKAMWYIEDKIKQLKDENKY